MQLGDFKVRANSHCGETSDEIRTEISSRLKKLANGWPEIWKEAMNDTFHLLTAAGKTDKKVFDSTSKALIGLEIIDEPECQPGYYLLRIELPDYLDQGYYIQWCKDFEGGKPTIEVLNVN